jgi:putative NIF3 family GTP cyclohydrolase 1 type 2
MLLTKLKDFLEILLSRDTFCRSDELTIQVGPQSKFSEKIVKKVLITQFLTIKSISFAKKEKINLIICRYGIPSFSLSCIDQFAQKHLLLLLLAHITVIVLPNQWDNITEGPTDYLAKILNLHYHKTQKNESNLHTVKTYISDKPLKMEDILSVLHRSLNVEQIENISQSDSYHRIFTIIPCTFPPKEIQLAKLHGADIIISPSLSPTYLMPLKFYELSFIQISFYSIIESSLQRLSSILATEFPRIEFIFYPSDPVFHSHLRKQNH